MNKRPFFQTPSLNGILFLLAVALLFYTNTHAVGKHIFLRFCWVGIILLFGLRTFYFGVVKGDRKKWVQRVFSVMAVAGFLFFVLEAGFMLVRTTVGASQALCTQGWFEKYWKPVNQYGYRDDQPTSREAVKDKVQITFLGDSFAAGQGIKDPDDRFPDLLRKKFPEDWLVFNHSACGYDTWDELMVMDKMPYEDIEPNVVVLQWFVNDIEGAAKREGLEYVPSLPLMDMPGMELLLNRSYFLNYLYVHTPWQTDFGYGEFLEAAYSNQKVQNRYESEFGQLVSWVTNTTGSKLVLVLFPSMSRPVMTGKYLEYAKGLGEARGLPVIDMTEIVLSLSPEERRVNAFDDHPSEKVHALAADAIYGEFQRQGWLDSIPEVLPFGGRNVSCCQDEESPP